MKYKAAILFAVVLAFGWGSAHADTPMACGERKQVVRTLKSDHAEEPVAMGLASNGAVIEVFASRNGSFTIMMTRTDGLSCLVAAGDMWEMLPEPTTDAKI